MSKTIEQSMMLVTSSWANIPSFSLMPVDQRCPYVECLYNPMAKTLAVIGKTKKDTFHMIPKLDDEGRPMKAKQGTQEEPFKKQRVTQESYTEYYITNDAEVENFIKMFAINADSYDYMQYINKPTMSDPSTLAEGPSLIIEK